MIDGSTPHPRGGYYFEAFKAGAQFANRLRRTGRPLMNSRFTLGLMTGISVNDLTVGTTIANLGMNEVRFPHSQFEGDTVNAATEALAVRESKSRSDAGVVEFHHRASKQDTTSVAECHRAAFMGKRLPSTIRV